MQVIATKIELKYIWLLSQNKITHKVFLYKLDKFTKSIKKELWDWMLLHQKLQQKDIFTNILKRWNEFVTVCGTFVMIRYLSFNQTWSYDFTTKNKPHNIKTQPLKDNNEAQDVKTSWENYTFKKNKTSSWEKK